MGVFTPKKQQLNEDEQDLVKKVSILIQAVERVYPSTTKLMYRSFLSGIFFSLGTTLGLSLLLAITTFFLTQLQHIPVVDQLLDKTFVEEVIPTETPSEE